MAGSRSTPPLFDLIRPASDRGEEVKPIPPAATGPAPSAAPARSSTYAAPEGPAPEPKRTASASPKPVIRLDTSVQAARPVPALEEAPRERATEGQARGGAAGVLTVPTMWAWLAVAGVLASWMLVWAVAYNSGQAEAQARLARFDQPQSGLASAEPGVGTPAPVLPRTDPGSGSGLPPEQGAKGGPERGQERGAGSPSPAPPAALPVDTRQAGFNYLLCASQLSKEAAEGAAAFLTANGVPAVAVGRGGKYTVYTLLGIPAGSLDEKLAVRNQHKAEVARIGREWRKARPGASDFSDAYWEKYKP